MKKMIFIIIEIMLIFPCSVNSQPKTNIQQNSRTYVENLRSQVQATNKTLPKKLNNDCWIWSTQMIDNTIIMTFKLEGDYLQFPIKDYFSNMAQEYAKEMSKAIGKEVDLWLSNKINLKFRCLSKKDDSFVDELLLTSFDLKRYQNVNTKTIGHRALSYYKSGFESKNSNLPIKLDECRTFVSVKMDSNNVYLDYYLDDVNFFISESQNTIIPVMRDEHIKEIKHLSEMGSEEMREDMITYNIIFHFRYYFQSSKKLAFSITIDSSDVLVK